MTEFAFISDDQLRILIERDKRELDNCLKSQLWKSTLLLAGSIIESILVDYFLAFPHAGSTPAQILNANLATLIDWAESDGLISQRTKEISTVTRNYRNLIHPGREYRLKERVDIYTATVAANLVEIIIQEVAENYAKKLGYTAEQAIRKVKLDPASSSIFEHMIGRMSPVERVRLFRAIPEACKQSDEVDAVVNNLIELHARLKSYLPREVIHAEVIKLYETVQNGSKDDATFLLRLFVSELSLLDDEQRHAVLAYALSVASTSTLIDLEKYLQWKIFSLGQYLDSDEGKEQIQDLIWLFLSQGDPESDSMNLRIITEIATGLSYDRIKSISEEISLDFEPDEREKRWIQAIEFSIVPF
jgi:hypothetical protein